MVYRQRYVRDCDCSCHSSNTRCNDCGNCRVPDEDVLSISTISTSSTATVDNKPGAGRGLDQLFQFLGRHLERRMAVALDRLGFGPAAVERRALRIIKKLRGEFIYVKQRHGKSVMNILSESEMIKLQTDLDKCCKLLLGHLRSSAPTTQYFALNALWKLRCANPLRVDHAFRALGLEVVVKSISHSLKFMERQPSDAQTLWRRKYVRPFDGHLLDSLLASSRKALIAVKDNDLHAASKSLLQLKGVYSCWLSPCYAYVAPRLRTIAKFILDTDLAFMAVAYVGKIGLRRHIRSVDEDLSIASVSIMENLRIVCSFHANHLHEEGKA